MNEQNRGFSADDIRALRRAADVLRRRSKKPNGLWMNVLCRLLSDTADSLCRCADGSSVHDFDGHDTCPACGLGGLSFAPVVYDKDGA